MGERGDVGRADSIVSGSERGGTFSFRNIDGSDLPPPYRALSLRHIGHFKDHTLSESSAYLYRVHCPPPAKHNAMPFGDTTMPFCEGLYHPNMIGLSVIGHYSIIARTK